MNAETLRAAMLDRITLDHARAMIPHYEAALHAAGCTTVNRSAMFAAQIGHESASLRYMEEIASGAAYEGRKDLGNTQRGDGKRYKGRGPIQLTGRTNYGSFSRWCHGRGLVPTPTYFVDRPTEVATPRWGFLAAAWYWVVARPKINGMCDAADLDGVTRAINGGRNGIADRRMRWDHCRRLGDRLLPGGTPAPAPAPAAGGRPTLRRGATGPAVASVIRYANATFPAYDMTPIPLLNPPLFGPGAEAFVREFQRRTGLTADGVIGPATWAMFERNGYRG